MSLLRHFKRHYSLDDRLSSTDKRFATFQQAFNLMGERKVGVIVETGTARFGSKHFDWDGGSTVLFADWIARHRSARLFSVDINKAHLKRAKKATRFRRGLTFICENSISFLANFKGQIDFLYLDSFDFDVQNPEPSQVHHLKEIEAAYDKLLDNSLVMIDDCDLPYGGKGKLVIEYLLVRGWKKLAEDYQVILSR